MVAHDRKAIIARAAIIDPLCPMSANTNIIVSFTGHHIILILITKADKFIVSITTNKRIVMFGPIAKEHIPFFSAMEEVVPSFAAFVDIQSVFSLFSAKKHINIAIAENIHLVVNAASMILKNILVAFNPNKVILSLSVEFARHSPCPIWDFIRCKPGRIHIRNERR